MYRQIGSVTGKGAGSAVTHIVAGVFLANIQMWLATLLTALGMDGVRQTLFG